MTSQKIKALIAEIELIDHTISLKQSEIDSLRERRKIVKNELSKEEKNIN
jgi:FtsZ-binding cell division protein ZapB